MSLKKLVDLLKSTQDKEVVGVRWEVSTDDSRLRNGPLYTPKYMAKKLSIEVYYWEELNKNDK